jgi:hypothetical protein
VTAINSTNQRGNPMFSEEETIARILAMMGPPSEVPRRRDESAAIMAARAFALAFIALRRDLLARDTLPAARRHAANRLLEPDMAVHLSLAEEEYARRILARRSHKSGGRVISKAETSLNRPNGEPDR